MLRNFAFCYLRILFYDRFLFFAVISPATYIALVFLVSLAEGLLPGYLGILFLALALPFGLSFFVSAVMGRTLLAEYILDRSSKNDWLRQQLRRMLDRLEAERRV